jgi:para-nitrobenzyl esterase
LPNNEALTMGELESFAAAIAGGKGKALINAYATKDSTAGDIQFAITTDWVMAFGMRRWAEYQSQLGQPTYLYYVDHVPPAFHIYMPDKPDLKLAGGRRSGGAYHSGDLALVFGTTDKVGLDWIDEDHQVSRQMVRYWTNFAKTGDPNGEDLPMWPRFDDASQNTLVISPVSQSEPGVDRERLDLMGSIWPM